MVDLKRLAWTPPKSTRYNILFLVADDMRPEIKAYHDPVNMAAMFPYIHTPNLDKLAGRSALFKRAYAQEALCAPSRASFLTSRRPDTTRVYDAGTYWRTEGGNFTTIPQYFKEHGYVSVGVGKIFHGGQASGHDDDSISWSTPVYHPDNQHWTKEQQYAWGFPNDTTEQENPLEDSLITRRAIQELKRLAPKAIHGEQPFFLGVGFMRPHLPLLCPEKYARYYPDYKISLPRYPFAPWAMPDIAWSNFHTLRSFENIRELGSHGSINSTLPDWVTKKMRQAYYTCVTYVDDMIGRILWNLNKLGLRNNTIVVFLGDHGYQLGEHGEWEKQTNFELAIQAPLMISIPGLTDNGVIAHQLVEFVDIFPTLVEAAGFRPLRRCPRNSSGIALCTEGASLIPVIQNPNEKWKSAAFSQYPRMSMEGEVVMGYSIRTEHFRYTEWIKLGICATHYKIDHAKKKELYDHKMDPNENVNLFKHVEYREVLEQLHEQLVNGWRAAFPLKEA